MKKGIFITLEGVDGAGKSSHIEFLTGFFKRHNYPVVFTREPGGTTVGEQLRDILLHQSMHVETEVLLMFAARQESLLQVVKPALAQGKVVISDRFTDSTFAYQSGGRGYDICKSKQLAQLVHADLQPDLTLLFDVPLVVAKSRLHASRLPDRFEQENDVFFEKVRHTYLDLVQQDPGRFMIVDATQTIAQIRLFLEQELNRFMASKSI